MSYLDISEHLSPLYPPRTYTNAREADLTVAFALDFNSKGEQLTKKAADKKYLALSLYDTVEVNAETLHQFVTEHPIGTLNIAGNSIHTLHRMNCWGQPRVNQYVYDVIASVHARLPFQRIICGGQTGVDIAGAVAGVALKIPVGVLMPRGFIQRDVNGYDSEHSPPDIWHQIVDPVAYLKKG